MIDFVKKHKERVTLLGVGLAFLIFFGIGNHLQKKTKLEKDPQRETSPKSVQLEMKTEGKGMSRKDSTAATPSPSYFLKPSPGELIAQLASMENLTEAAVDAKFSQLPVLWPVYFFSLRENEDGRNILLLDVSEDGFGVVIESEVDLSHYPQLRELSTGEKIWIGGKILAVDRAGTGTIYLKTEKLSFGSEAPFSPTLQKP